MAADPANVPVVAHLPNTWAQITRATYARLYISEVLPSSTRALYLDCDLIARRSVGELFDLDMNGKAALAVPDMQSPFVSSHQKAINVIRAGNIGFLDPRWVQ
jgi:lipopolysaccharide biosynthesis glycosyltransferase